MAVCSLTGLFPGNKKVIMLEWCLGNVDNVYRMAVFLNQCESAGKKELCCLNSVD